MNTWAKGQTNSIIIQQNWGHNIFTDMQRLTVQRHMAYARAFKMDYWCINGEIHPEQYPAGWGKLWLIKDAMKRRYKWIFWIDADAGIFDMNADLHDALKDKPFDIGACVHDPAKSAHLKKNEVPKHMNIGVLYIRVTPKSKKFISDWLARFPGEKRWMEQGSFNVMAKDSDVVGQADDKWNATVRVNEVAKPVVKGYHGIPHGERIALMRKDFGEDHIKFRV